MILEWNGTALLAAAATVSTLFDLTRVDISPSGNSVRIGGTFDHHRRFKADDLEHEPAFQDDRVQQRVNDWIRYLLPQMALRDDARCG